MTEEELNHLLRALLARPSGSGYAAFGDALHRLVAFDRLTIYVVEPDGESLRVQQALSGDDGVSDVVGRLVPIAGNLAGRALRSGRTLRIEDLPPGGAALGVDHEGFEDLRRAAQAGMRSGLLCPLRPLRMPAPAAPRDEVIGVAELWSRRRAAFTPAHEATLAQVLPALAAAVSNDSLYIAAERGSLELRALERLARASRRSLDLAEVLPASLDAALSLLSLSTGGILLRQGDRLNLALARKLRPPAPLSVPLAPAEREEGQPLHEPLRACFHQQRPVLYRGLSAHPAARAALGLPPGGERAQWLLVLPLGSRDGGRGVVFACGHGAPPAHSAAELERLATVGHWIGYAIADAERHGVAREQASANALYRHLITHLHDAVVATDPGGRIVEWTGGAENQSGWAREDVLGLDLMRLLFGEQAETARSVVTEQLQQRGLFRGEGVLRRRDGTVAHWETLLARTELPGGHGMLGVCRDVGEVRRQAEELRKQRQLESLSSLAGGLAHDFNNTLGAVLLTALLVRDAARAGERERLRGGVLAQDMDVIIDAAKRGAALAGQLLAFSRGAPLDMAPLDVGELVAEALRAQRGRAADLPAPQIEARLAPDLPLTRGDRQQLVRALQNVLQNGQDAMPGGGRLVIETLQWERPPQPGGPVSVDSLLVQPQPEAGYWPVPAGRYLRITVQDEGTGIDPQVRARLFEPFVTTKTGASGLGLAVVFGVVKAHGGFVSVCSVTEGEAGPGWSWPPQGPEAQAEQRESRPRGQARGTLVRIDLPVAAAGAGATAARAAAPPPERTTAARVLVVDDEPVLTRIAARVLRGARYVVHTASNGADALQRYQRPLDFDLVLLDATMPGMSGREVLDELLRRDPQARVLVMSGYSGETGPQQLLGAGARRFLPKPFTPQELLQAVNAVLDEGG